MQRNQIAAAIKENYLHDERPSSRKKYSKCFTCGREFERKRDSHLDWQGDNLRFCSQRCRDALNNGIPAYHEQEVIAERLKDASLFGWKVVAGSPGSQIDSDYYKPLRNKITRIEQRKNCMSRLHELADAIEASYRRISDEAIRGKTGEITATDFGWKLSVQARSKRHLSGIKRRLAFLDLDADHHDSGSFKITRIPSEREAVVIREVLGIRKVPSSGGVSQ